MLSRKEAEIAKNAVERYREQRSMTERILERCGGMNHDKGFQTFVRQSHMVKMVLVFENAAASAYSWSMENVAMTKFLQEGGQVPRGKSTCVTHAVGEFLSENPLIMTTSSLETPTVLHAIGSFMFSSIVRAADKMIEEKHGIAMMADIPTARTVEGITLRTITVLFLIYYQSEKLKAFEHDETFAASEDVETCQTEYLDIVLRELWLAREENANHPTRIKQRGEELPEEELAHGEETRATGFVSPVVIVDFHSSADYVTEKDRIHLENGSKLPHDFFDFLGPTTDATDTTGSYFSPKQLEGWLCLRRTSELPSECQVEFLTSLYGTRFFEHYIPVYRNKRISAHRDELNACLNWTQHVRGSTVNGKNVLFARPWIQHVDPEHGTEAWGASVGAALLNDNVDQMVNALAEQNVLYDQVFDIDVGKLEKVDAEHCRLGTRSISVADFDPENFSLHEMALLYNAEKCVAFLNSKKPVSVAPHTVAVCIVQRAIWEGHIRAFSLFLEGEYETVAAIPDTTSLSEWHAYMQITKAYKSALMDGPLEEGCEKNILHSFYLWATHVTSTEKMQRISLGQHLEKIWYKALERNKPHVLGWIRYGLTGFNYTPQLRVHEKVDTRSNTLNSLLPDGVEHQDYSAALQEYANKTSHPTVVKSVLVRCGETVFKDGFGAFLFDTLSNTLRRRQTEMLELAMNMISDYFAEKPPSALHAFQSAVKAELGDVLKKRNFFNDEQDKKDAFQHYCEYVDAYLGNVETWVNEWTAEKEEKANHAAEALKLDLEAEELREALLDEERAIDRGLSDIAFIMRHGLCFKPDDVTVEGWEEVLDEKTNKQLKKLREKVAKKMGDEERAASRIVAELKAEAIKADKWIRDAASSFKGAFGAAKQLYAEGEIKEAMDRLVKRGSKDIGQGVKSCHMTHIQMLRTTRDPEHMKLYDEIEALKNKCRLSLKPKRKEKMMECCIEVPIETASEAGPSQITPEFKSEAPEEPKLNSKARQRLRRAAQKEEQEKKRAAEAAAARAAAASAPGRGGRGGGRGAVGSNQQGRGGRGGRGCWSQLSTWKSPTAPPPSLPPPPPAPVATFRATHECMLCFEEIEEWAVLLPCMTMLCKPCAPGLVGTQCPTCRDHTVVDYRAAKNPNRQVSV